MDYGLKGKTAVVTGGGRGLGGGISEVLASEGANVIVADRTQAEDSDELVARLNSQYGVKAVFVACDISDPDLVTNCFDVAIAETGRVDILVNCAGLTGPSTNGLIGEMSKETFFASLNVNLMGTFLMTTEFVKRVTAAGVDAEGKVNNGAGARIVNICSKASVSTTSKGHACLTVTKSGIAGFTRQCAVDLTDKGIIVNGIMPGSATNSRFKGTEEDMADPRTQKALARLPLHRFATPLEIGQMVAWLTSDANPLAVGAVIDATGGLLT